MIRISRENIYFYHFWSFSFFFFNFWLHSARCEWSSVACCCIKIVWHQLITCRQTIKYQICKTCLYRKSHGLIGPSFSYWVDPVIPILHTSHWIFDCEYLLCLKLSGLVSLSLFTSQNGCKLRMAVVFHLVYPFDLFSLATRDFSCCAVRDLFAFRSML